MSVSSDKMLTSLSPHITLLFQLFDLTNSFSMNKNQVLVVNDFDATHKCYQVLFDSN